LQKFCSAIAGPDISARGGDPEKVIRAVRDWLRSSQPNVMIPSGSQIVARYRHFRDDLPMLGATFRLDVDELTFIDCQNIVVEWLRANG